MRLGTLLLPLVAVALVNCSAARLDKTYPEAIEAAQAAAALHNELLKTLRTLQEVQPANDVVHQELLAREASEHSILQRVHDLIENRDDPRSVEAGLNEAQTLTRRLQTALDWANAILGPGPALGTARNSSQPPRGDPSSTPSLDHTPDPEAIQELRADATTAVNEVESLHDALIRRLETVADAHRDDWAKRQAVDDVTLAQFAKRHDLARLRGDIAAEERWRIEAAIRHAAIVRDRLQAQIAALEE